VDQIINDYSRTCYPRRSTLPEEPLVINTGDSVNPTDYRSTLGLLMYLCGGTWPDLSYLVNLLARYSANPSAEHWQALDVLIGYLKRTRELGLVMKKGNEVMELWLDANWGGEHERLTSGYLIKHNGNSVAWGAKRQTVVALSACAAEYVALSGGAQQLAHLHNLIIDIDQLLPLKIYCNNEAAILISGDNTLKKKTQYLSPPFTSSTISLDNTTSRSIGPTHTTKLPTSSPNGLDQTSSRRPYPRSIYRGRSHNQGRGC
jgi:hypothetical protein